MKTAIIAILVLMALLLPATAQSVGSRDNPVPMGTSAGVVDNWVITVLSVIPNATDEKVYGNDNEYGLKFKRNPDEEFFLAKIQAKYIGPGSSYFDSSDLSVVGSASVGYNSLGFQGDGMIQDHIPNHEVFTGGVITGIVAWIIPQADANHLVMYGRAIDINERTYMALFES